MKYVRIIQCTNSGGMERTASERLRGLRDECGVGVKLVSPRPAGGGAALFQQFDPGMTFFDYRGRYNVFGHRAFARHVRKIASDVDVVCVTGTCGSSLAAANITGKPVVLDHHYHHGPDRWSRLKWRGFYELLCRNVKAIVYVSPSIRNEAVSIAPWIEEKSHVVRQTIPVPFVSTEDRATKKGCSRARLGLPPNAWIVCNAGWLIQRKRFDVFLSVAAELKRRVPEAYFVICGDGDQMARLKEQCKDLGIGEAVRFDGWVENLSDHFWASDALLFNTDFDAIGRTPLEAVGYGLPVVASSRYGGLAEFFEEGNRGFFFGDHDIGGMTDALQLLRHAEDVYATVVQEAVQHLRKNYSNVGAAERLFNIYFGRSF
jgi:L-malate glycosyltransferase